MPGDLLDLLGKATNEMRDFLQRVRESDAQPASVDASRVKSLTARLRRTGEAIRAARPQEVSRARASSVYGEYKDLLAQVQHILKPFHDRLVARQGELGMKQTQVQAVRAWAAAYERTR
ncbi:MAG TPA: hypothetical protein VHX49_09100 [Candidatus Acidoferrales bacterium]|jgi:hypothetical protein|nr:hypothetical protein [Candidatus Acidoferrales bacterium]